MTEHNVQNSLSSFAPPVAKIRIFSSVKKNFRTPPCDSKKRKARLGEVTNSCPYPVLPAPVYFGDRGEISVGDNYRKKKDDVSFGNTTVCSSWAEDGSNSACELETAISFLTESQTKVKAELLIARRLLELKVIHLQNMRSVLEQCPASKAGNLLTGGCLDQLKEAEKELKGLIQSASVAEEEFGGQQAELFRIMKTLKEQRAKIGNTKRKLNEKAFHLLSGFFDCDKKEQIRRRKEAIGLELEIEYLNDREESVYLLKSEIAKMVPKMKGVFARFMGRTKRFVLNDLESKAEAVASCKKEKFRGQIDIVRVVHSQMFGKDGVPII